MTAFDLARRAYAAPGAPTRTPRGTEYDLFARITQRLKAAMAPATGPQHGGPQFPALVRALHDNRDLWAVLAQDVADDANGLPLPLRQQIFALAAFTASHTRRVLTGAAGAEVLIDINTAMMRGLRPQQVAQ